MRNGKIGKKRTLGFWAVILPMSCSNFSFSARPSLFFKTNLFLTSRVWPSGRFFTTRQEGRNKNRQKQGRRAKSKFLVVCCINSLILNKNLRFSIRKLPSVLNQKSRFPLFYAF